jgi:hypothetical protein
VKYLSRRGRETFERPYGLAWLLQLAAELASGTTPMRAGGARALRPLEAAPPTRIGAGCPSSRTRSAPASTARPPSPSACCSTGRARPADDRAAALTEERSRALYLEDRGCPLVFEPSGQDFLSPCLAEADLMRRLLPPAEYAAWLGRFLPEIPREGGRLVAGAGGGHRPTDGKLAHLDGLNLSRAWMLEGIAAGLPEATRAGPPSLAAAAAHRRSGLASVTGEHYEGGHWLGSFAVYLVTGRGLPASTTSRHTSAARSGR